MWLEGPRAGADVAASGHHAVRDAAQSSDAARELRGMRCEDDHGPVRRETFAVHADV